MTRASPVKLRDAPRIQRPPPAPSTCPSRDRSSGKPGPTAVTHGQADAAPDLGTGTPRAWPRRPP